MAKLMYLDILRMVSPGDCLEHSLFDFYVFGSFDAIKVEQQMPKKALSHDEVNIISTLHDLHSISKHRRMMVPEHFDKHPIHIYTPNDLAGEIFRIDGEYASLPLVLTLIQLDDSKLQASTPDELIEKFRENISTIKQKENIESIIVEVFFCLGEPDILIAFRSKHLSDIATLIYRIKLGFENYYDEDICVLSTSSHCAFPNAVSEKELNDNLKDWINNENDIRLFTMFDTSYGLDNDASCETDSLSDSSVFKSVFLGKWDYIYEWDKENIISDFMDRMFKPITAFNMNVPGLFRSSYSFPVIGLKQEDIGYAKSARSLNAIKSKTVLREYANSGTVFGELSQKIESLDDIYGSALITSLSSAVKSMQSALDDVLKYLWQLRDGRFQYDLYAIVLPAFEALPLITTNVISSIEQIQKNYSLINDKKKRYLQKEYGKTISDLLDNYIHDTSRLLAELQQLFSVLSVSPYTYLESFGNNMRSITATCKLLVAYQGIAFCLSRDFDMKLSKNGDYINANEVMLVIPYRGIHQTTNVLYERTSPENRIVYIRINASDMFRVPKTVFMLLHECGHHILSYQFRKKRVDYFFEAFSGYLLDQGFDSFYDSPHIAIQIHLNSCEDSFGNGSIPQKVHILNTSEASLRDAIIAEIRSSVDLEWQLRDYWDKEYKVKGEVKAFAEQLSLDNNFLNYIKNAACSYIEDRLDEFYGHEDEKDYLPENPFTKTIMVLIQKIFAQFQDVVNEEYQLRQFNDDNELWRLSELKTIYQGYPEERIKSHVRKICLEVLKPTYIDIANELKMIFSDIYSDVFALSMLGIREKSVREQRREARKYIELLRDEAGFKLKEEFDHSYLLIRILCVIQEYFLFSEKETDKLILDVLSLPRKDTDYILQRLNYTRTRIGYEAVKEYTVNLCIATLEKQIDKSDVLKQNTKRLYEMYYNDDSRNSPENLINAMYYFWKSSTQRVKNE